MKTELISLTIFLKLFAAYVNAQSDFIFCSPFQKIYISEYMDIRSFRGFLLLLVDWTPSGATVTEIWYNNNLQVTSIKLEKEKAFSLVYIQTSRDNYNFISSSSRELLEFIVNETANNKNFFILKKACSPNFELRLINQNLIFSNLDIKDLYGLIATDESDNNLSPENNDIWAINIFIQEILPVHLRGFICFKFEDKYFQNDLFFMEQGYCEEAKRNIDFRIHRIFAFDAGMNYNIDFKNLEGDDLEPLISNLNDLTVGSYGKSKKKLLFFSELLVFAIGLSVSLTKIIKAL